MYAAQLVTGSPEYFDHTPAADITAGDVVVIGDLPAVSASGIDAGKLGAVAVSGGVYRMTANASIAAGKAVWFDATNNQVTETAAGNPHFGTTMEASDADNLVRVYHQPQGVTGAIV